MKMLDRVKHAFNGFKDFITGADKLPVGMQEFELFVDAVAELTGLPKNDKLKYTIAQFIWSLPPTTSAYSKHRLANQIRKAASNQVCHEAFKLLNEKEKATDTEKPSKDLGPKT